MYRRPFLAALGGAAMTAASSTQTAMATANDPLDDIDLVEHDQDWIDRQLRDHYGARFHEPPGEGIYHHKADSVWRVPTSRTALLQRAGVLCELPQPDYETDAYDCEDFAFRLYSALTMAVPRMAVGIAFNFAGDHAYNVFVTDDGEVIEYEPQRGAVVTESEDSLYDFENGILYI